MISRLSNIMKSRLNRKLENFVQNEFEVANHIEMEAYLTLRRFCMKFLDFTRTFQNLQALATRLLHTIGSKPVANAQTMENNVNIVARAFAFKITNFRTI